MKKEQKRISKRMKELRGKLRKKAKGGNYYYRLTITNGIRKCQKYRQRIDHLVDQVTF